MTVLGDIIDKGSQSIRLLDMIARSSNIVAIMGNHEYDFVGYVGGVFASSSSCSDSQVLEQIGRYFRDESGSIDWALLDYIQQLPYYIEGDNYICVHAGVALDSKGSILPMCSQLPQVMLYDRNFKASSVAPVSSKTVLYGHTPCSYDNGTGHFVKQLRQGMQGNRLEHYSKIRLDTGVAYTAVLGCLRIEDMQEFYIK